MSEPVWIDKDLGKVTPTDQQTQTAVDTYLAQVITNPDSPPLDRTLTSSSAATPADITGNLKSAFNRSVVIPGDDLVVVTDFTDESNVTTSIDSTTGEISITSISNGSYNCVQTADNYLYKLTPGKIYRLHAKAIAMAGNPNMQIAIRGVEGNQNGIAAIADVNNGDGFVDFVANEYMIRVTLFVTFGSGAKNSVAKFSDIWLKEYNFADDDIDSKVKGIEDANIYEGKQVWGKGTINVSTGEVSANQNIIRTGFVPNAKKVKVQNGYIIEIFGYQNDGTYVGVWTGGRFVKATYFLNGDIELPENDYIYKFVLRKSDLSTTNVSDGQNATFYFGVFEDMLWQQGAINGTDGSIETSDKYIYSSSFSGNDLIKLKSKSGYSFVPFAWDKTTGAFVGHWNGTDYEQSYHNFAYVQEFDMDNDYIYHLSMSRIDGNDIDPSEGKNVIFLTKDNIISSMRWESFKDAEDRELKNSFNLHNEQIVFSLGYMYVRRNGNTFSISVDGGKTYSKSIGIPTGFTHDFGILRNAYVFLNGTLLVCDHQYAYYTDDWITWHESSCIDLDGTTYTPTQYDTFTPTRRRPRMMINNTELYVFGNYNITDNAHNRDLIWYTTDNGHTLKVAYEFNISGAMKARHIHDVVWCEKQNNYWVCVGDSSTDSRVIKAVYDLANDAWTFEEIGSGLDYKWSGLCFYRDYFYYCHDVTPGQVVACKIGDEADISKHYVILDDLPNDAIGLFIGETTGEMLVTLSTYRTGTTTSTNTATYDSKRMWYSTDRINFVEINGNNFPELSNNPDSIIFFYCGPNAQGKILASYEKSPSEGGTFVDDDLLPSVFIDEFVKRSGFDCDLK